MKTTREFLADVKSRYSLPSDYALAPKLGITRAAVSRLQNGKDFLGDNTALQVAKLLDLNPAYVIACSNYERAKSVEIQSVWEMVAGRFCIMLNRRYVYKRHIRSEICHA